VEELAPAAVAPVETKAAPAKREEPAPATVSPAAQAQPAAAPPRQPPSLPSRGVRILSPSGGSRQVERLTPIVTPPRQPQQPAAAGAGPAVTSPQQPGGPAKPPGRRLEGAPSHPSHPGITTPKPPPSLRQRSGAPAADKGEKVAKPIARPSSDQLKQRQPLRPEDLLRPKVPGAPGAEEPVPTTEEEEGDKKKLKRIPGGQRRQEERNRRAENRKAKTAEVFKVVDGKILSSDVENRAAGKARGPKIKPKQGTMPRKGSVVIETPITVRALSEALGVRSVELLFKLREHGAPAEINLNSALDDELADVIALDYGIELDVKRPADPEEDLLASFAEPEDPEDQVLRAPIVTIMGHVDHGKTSLLDKIRKSNIVDTEAGGITQVIRAWRVQHNDKFITFLDTPGHEAFTKMRARGAQVTDIAVIVVAADDGVMPQTEEAITHAKAAGVSLVVAINKVDLPGANLNRTRQQLYGLDVLPDNMGGEAPFVETSAATGKGIDELLDQLSLVAELKELKANPNGPARGTCLEAALSEGEGVRATLLVQNGTLRRGDVILCGATYGRVRQMYDDMGRPLEEAGPTVPVRITGLDQVPDADDPFMVLPELTVARDIAENRQLAKQEAALVGARPALTLERLTEAKITELKIILKADFRGSIEAIRKELEKLKHEEVRVRILEAGIGAITENDVWLTMASPEDTLIVGFNVVPDDRAMALAEEKGVKIRQYDIIYNLTNDIRSALEGKLKPREEVVHLGRALIRETFKISRVGTIAGCYVTQGIMRRNAKIRVIRDGVVIYPPADRNAGLDSLKRFKDDASEVREGFECGIKVAGYDDIKVGDVIEAFRVEQVQRTLE
jgi:translation initiation factor IF-2